MIVPGATARNAQQYVVLASCGAVLVVCSLAAAYAARDVRAWYVGGAAAGLLLCAVSGTAIAVGVYRRAKALRESGGWMDSLSPAAKRHLTLSMIGPILMLCGAGLQWLHGMFGVREFTGQWLVEILCFMGGLLLQQYSQAMYLQDLG